jgi:hypothetical protein
MTKAEKYMADAPGHYNASEASAWASGYNACLAAQADALLPIPADKYAVDDPWCRPADLPQSLSIEETRQRAEDAVRTFCRSLGAAAVQMSHGEERIYYAGISLKALSVAVAMAVSRPDGNSK